MDVQKDKYSFPPNIKSKIFSKISFIQGSRNYLPMLNLKVMWLLSKRLSSCQITSSESPCYEWYANKVLDH